ncbi:hypothetical protein VTK56DRAFT_2883 [Thermocarpiscus australiensis]
MSRFVEYNQSIPPEIVMGVKVWKAQVRSPVIEDGTNRHLSVRSVVKYRQMLVLVVCLEFAAAFFRIMYQF